MSGGKPDPIDELHRLLENYRTASLATVNASGAPQVSYVPFAVNEERRFFFFVSELAEHTPNLRANPRASLMLIDDEEKSSQLFARNRLTINGAVEPIARDSAQWQPAADRYRERFGKFFDMLCGLPDFHMFCLVPSDVRLVLGFGSAYQVTGPEWEQLTLLKGR